jgi:tetratricopeptide (TPR) repeat protein
LTRLQRIPNKPRSVSAKEHKNMPARNSTLARKAQVFGCFALAASAGFLGSSLVAAEPYRPTDDSVVLAVVPRSAVTKQADFRNLYKKLAQNPSDLKTAIGVARLAIADGRANADPRSFGQAQAALAPWWSDKEAPPEARLLRAIILRNLEDYPAAEADLDAVLAKEPQNVEARLTRAFVRETTGALAEARKDCEALPDSVGAIPTAICFAKIEILTGAAAQALERLKAALAADEKATPEVKRHALALAAEAAASLGLTDEAGKLYVEATADGNDIPVLVAYADFLLDDGRPADVLALLGERSEADSVLVRLVIAGKATGDPRTARWTELISERFAADRANDIQTNKRDRARFELEIKENADAALGLARANWKAQKEIPDAKILLQSAIAADDPDSAGAVLSFIKANGLADVRLKPLQDKIAESK